MKSKSIRQVGYLYLTLIPFLAAAAAFLIGHISYRLYVPIWIITSTLMLLAAWILGGQGVRSTDKGNKHLALSSLLLILPWVFISIFFGMGPPPSIPSIWIERSTEQQTRYTILTMSGILFALGFAGMRTVLKNIGEDFYSTLGLMSVGIAIPLYLMYISLLHSFDFEAFKLSVAATSGRMPDWYIPIEKQYNLVMIIQAALLYVATALFANSLHKAKLIHKSACYAYSIISLIASLLVILYPLYDHAVAFMGIFPLLIPAVPFIMPYLLGVNLLKRAGKTTIESSR